MALVKLPTLAQTEVHDDVCRKLKKRLKMDDKSWGPWYTGFVRQCLGRDRASDSTQMKKLIAALLARFRQEINKPETDPVLLKKIWTVARKKGIDEDLLRAMVVAVSGDDSTKRLNFRQAIELISSLEEGRPVRVMKES